MDLDDTTVIDGDPPALATGAVGLARRGRVAILDLDGEFDIYAAGEVRARCRAELRSGRGCVVDVCDVTFVDSSILGALLDAKRRAASLDLPLVLVLPDGRHPVRRAIESAGLRFVSRPDLPAAVSAVRRRARSRRRAGTAPCSAVPD